MLTDWKFWTVAVLLLAALGLSIANVLSQRANVSRQQEVVARQEFILESARLSNFNSQFITALANLAVQTGDETIHQLLAENGITYSVKTPVQAEGDEEADNE